METIRKSADAAVVEGSSPVSSSAALVSYQQAAAASVRERLPEVTRVLQAANVTKVGIVYDGAGDSGQIEEVQYDDAAGHRFVPHLEGTTEDELVQFFYDLLEVRHGGWENDEGAWGEFEWDVVADTLHHTHHTRLMQHDTTERDGP